MAAPIARLIAVSFDTVTVPDAFKEAHVTPVYKGKGKSAGAMDSYRPVAVLPALSKVLEAVTLARLNPHLQQYLPGEQWGFRKGRNTVEAVCFAHGAWNRAVQAGKHVVVAAFDYTCAFDTLDADVLVSKLKRLNIGERPRSWLRNYLSGRCQRTKWDNTLSDIVKVNHGVPQGSLLGPVLFTCLVAELPGQLESVDRANEDTFGGSASYADDIVAWSTGDTAESAKAHLEAKAAAMACYSAAHLLSLNPGKTQILWLGRKAGGKEALTININGVAIHPSKTLEMLGITYDSYLSSSPHLEKQVAAGKAIRGTIRRLSLHLPRGPVLKMVAGALVTGKLSYGAAATLTPRWKEEDTKRGAIHELQVLINDVARSLLGRRRSDRISTEELLKKSGLPSLNHFAVRSIAVEAWKAMSGINSPYDPLQGLLGEAGSGSSRTRAAAAGHLPPPLQKAAQTFIWEAHKIWNNHRALREAKSLVAAKKVAKDMTALIPF